ncbi:MAG: ketopantoate reductase C-terminal domain-containing protein, partial [Pseudomonadota bacterium]
VSAIVGWGGTMHGPGDVERTGPGAIHLGELDGRRSERVLALQRLLEPTGEVVVSDNIRGALWSKLAINCTITTAGALTGQTLGAMLGGRRARTAFLGVYREVIDTALALGVKLERIATDPMLLYLPTDSGAFRRWSKDLLVHLVGLRYRRLKSSSLQSIERGRRTEIDFLNGYVVEQARSAGVATPLNAALTRLIKEIEQGQRVPSPANLDALLSSIT